MIDSREGRSPTSLEDSKEIVRKGIEAANKHDLDFLDDIIIPGFVNHTIPLHSLEEMKQYLAMQIRAFPDVHWTIEDIAAEGDKVWVRYRITGTHTKELRGLAPTGRKIEFLAVTIYRLANGKITEGWSIMEFFNFYKQLGVLEYKGFPDESL